MERSPIIAQALHFTSTPYHLWHRFYLNVLLLSSKDNSYIIHARAHRWLQETVEYVSSCVVVYWSRIAAMCACLMTRRKQFAWWVPLLVEPWSVYAICCFARNVPTRLHVCWLLSAVWASACGLHKTCHGGRCYITYPYPHILRQKLPWPFELFKTTNIQGKKIVGNKSALLRCLITANDLNAAPFLQSPP